MSPDPSHQSEGRINTEGEYVPSAGLNQEHENDISHEGYEILPQEFSESNHETEDLDTQQDSNSDDDSSVNDTPISSTFDQAVQLELKELWSSSSNDRITDIVMDSKKEEEIKSAMAGFRLPSTSIPTWAKNIPEEQWEQQILSKINSLKKH